MRMTSACLSTIRSIKPASPPCGSVATDREITTTERGKRIATSLEGTLTGLGGNLIVIDDPLKLGDAMSEAVRARVIEWFRSTLLSRGDDKSATRIVVVMQRVHENDLVGYLLEQGGFEVLICLRSRNEQRPMTSVAVAPIRGRKESFSIPTMSQPMC